MTRKETEVIPEYPNEIYIDDVYWYSPDHDYPHQDVPGKIIKAKDGNLDKYVRAPEWVSVEDGVPKVGSDVWVDTGKKVPVLGKFDVVDWDDWDGNSTSGECFTDNTWEEIIPDDEVIGWCYANIPAPPEVK